MEAVLRNVSPENRCWLQKLEMNLMCVKKLKEMHLYIDSERGL